MRYRPVAICIGLCLTLFFFKWSGPCACAWAFGWSDYKAGFISNDGRVIDYYKGDISHSEGQGYGLILAVLNSDRATFEKIWNWTRDNLQVRKGDKLFCWSWGRRPNGRWQIIDYNNASDGDILIGWALYLAWEKWKEPRFKEAAREIVSAIRTELTISEQGKLFLLPGYYGFYDAKKVVLNPSYLVLRAFEDFSRCDSPLFWKKVVQSSKEFLKSLRFGQWLLPPDWAFFDRKARSFFPFKRGPCFSWDAWRVFLYGSWVKEPALMKGFQYLFEYFEKNGYLPQSVDLKKDKVSLKSASAGVYAALASYALAFGREKAAQKLFGVANGKVVHQGRDYFSASLYLLSKARFR